MTRELVPVYKEQVIGDPDSNRTFFTALNVGLESPPRFTFCAGDRQRHHRTTVTAVRPTVTGREAHRLCDAQITEQTLNFLYGK